MRLKDYYQMLAASPIDELIDECRKSPLPSIGKNSRVLLNELGLRLDCPADALALILIRPKRVTDPEDTSVVYHWQIYDADRVAYFRTVPGRQWNSTTKSNTFVVHSGDVPALIDEFRALTHKLVIVDDASYRIEDGKGLAEWNEPTLYNLAPEPMTVNLAEVLKAYMSLRPNDTPLRLALHSEVDNDYRTLFDKGIRTDYNTLSSLQFTTRHEQLLFRVSAADGWVRYLEYSVPQASASTFHYTGSKNATRVMAQFKEAQQRLAHPVIEPNDILQKQLKIIESDTISNLAKPKL